MIVLDNIAKVFYTDEIKTTALSGLNLTVEQGEFLAVMGPSGGGKSTLLNILGMLDTPSSGSFHFNGNDISHFSPRELSKVRKRNVGFIFQDFNLINELNVFQNVELALLYQGMSTSERHRRVMEILQAVSMEHRVRHYPSKLSGGQQQRVAIARALVADPRLVVADEPTGNLDSKLGEEVMQILQDFNTKGTTIVMVTHSTPHAQYAHRIVSLLDGKVASELNNKRMTKAVAV